MNLTQIEKKLQNLVEYLNPFNFVYDLLSAYNLPKATITRLKKGSSNLSKNQGEVILKKKLFFREERMLDLHETISAIEQNHKHDERFLIVTDYKIFLAVDTKTKDRLDVELKDLPKHYEFFLPWAGMEKTQHANENPADVKAAERMAKLFDAIKKNNQDESEEFVHSLNIFLSRLLFCFFAEDTNIFQENQFTTAISSHTQQDGSDLDEYLKKLFNVLNTPNHKRNNLPAYLEAFPYVNGGLFKENIQVPKLNKKSRQLIIDSGELDWSDINPDIFGSMFQAVIHVDQRGALGQHYTSVPNIMKVIEPLFLNELKDTFDKAKGNKERLQDLLRRLKNIRIFDPACGSGNFLIIAYKELRRLEIQILHEIKSLEGKLGTGNIDFGTDYSSYISLNSFYGIELDDFAHEIAKLALWLAEHQMNQEFLYAMGRTNPTLPLRATGNVYQGNATRINWLELCPVTEDVEVFILGNPPYLGSSMQDASQKADSTAVLSRLGNYKNLDYIACWFIKASDFIEGRKCSYAFVSTNSICQGDQVALLWPSILGRELEIGFAYTTFKWFNNAKGNAGVSVVIIGVRNSSTKPKHIYTDNRFIVAQNISPYLTNSANIFLTRRSVSISGLPKLVRGSMPTDGGHFVLTEKDKNYLLSEYPTSEKFIKRLLSGGDFLKGIARWCLWIEDGDLSAAMAIPVIKKRLDLVREFRLRSRAPSTVEYAKFPNRFRQIAYKNTPSVIIPLTSSERRQYIPMMFLGPDTVVTNSAGVIYDAEPWVMGVISSRMHMVWVKAVAGRLKSDYRYSSALCYNTFPFPNISNGRKTEIANCVYRILDEREKHPEKTLSQLYDPLKMPHGLLEAHETNDIVIEKCFRSRPFMNDDERLEYLFGLYDKFISDEQNANTLFAKQKKKRKKK